VRTTYGKLIRDRIPELLGADGVRYEVTVLDQHEFRAALLAKLQEEAAEVARAESEASLVTEVADLLEVVAALLAAEGIANARVEEAQVQRRQARGGFERRLQLVWTER
jgi:predicted house-cleaning noncanonical NTP pyrophosphatase (MazG superfamily)